MDVVLLSFFADSFESVYLPSRPRRTYRPFTRLFVGVDSSRAPYLCRRSLHVYDPCSSQCRTTRPGKARLSSETRPEAVHAYSYIAVRVQIRLLVSTHRYANRVQVILGSYYDGYLVAVGSWCMLRLSLGSFADVRSVDGEVFVEWQVGSSGERVRV